MRRRHGAVLAAVTLCLGGALTACGSNGGDGYVAVGAAGSTPEGAPTAAVPPKGKVELVPLDGDQEGRQGRQDPEGQTPGRPDEPTAPGTPQTPGTPGADGSANTPEGSDPPAAPGGDNDSDSPGDSTDGSESPGTPATPPGTTPPKPTPSPTPPPTRPPGPAVLTLGEPVRAALEDRWCEKVTVEFRNTGGSPATSGTVTFGTHIIGALGIDWATIESAQPLPAPIAAGSVRKKAYTVCVDAWRVPLGMHIETQDVTAVWK